MQYQHEVSRLQVEIGPDFQGQGKTYTEFELHFFEQKASEQLQYLKSLVGDELDLEWALVFSIQAQPGQGEKLKAAIILNYNDPIILEETSAYLFKTFLKGDTVYVSLKGTPDTENNYMEPFNMFFNQGLEQIASEQKNALVGSIKSNVDFYYYLSLLNSGERFLSAFFKSIKIDIQMDVHKQLSQKVKDIVQNFDPEFVNEFPMIFLQMFKNFDLELKFKNTDDLPEIIKKQGLFGKKLQDQSSDNALKLNERQEEIVKSIGDDHEVWLTIPNCLALHFSIKATGFSQIVKEYGSGLIQLLNI